MSRYLYTFSLHFSGVLAAVAVGINPYIIYGIYTFNPDTITLWSANRSENSPSYDIPYDRILAIGI